MYKTIYLNPHIRNTILSKIKCHQETKAQQTKNTNVKETFVTKHCKQINDLQFERKILIN